MKSKAKIAICVLMSLVLAVGIIGCGSGDSASQKGTKGSGELASPSANDVSGEGKGTSDKVQTAEGEISGQAQEDSEPENSDAKTTDGNASEQGEAAGGDSGQRKANGKPSDGQSVKANTSENGNAGKGARSPSRSPNNTPCQQHGRLSVKGTQLVDKNQKLYQLRGVSIFFLQYANIDSFRTMRDQWGINMVRLPLYTAGYDGYCTSGAGKRAELKKKIYEGIDAAIDLGLYVIVDWHVLHEGDPNTYRSEAIAFFKEVSQKYAGYDNVLYEICNEPNGNANWSSIKSYAESVLPAIKNNVKDAVVIVGTPTWSQDVDQAAANPVKGYNNLMYALHFYAETHRDSLRQKTENAIRNGLPVFVSEFGICDASGNGRLNKSEAAKWMSLINKYGLSFSIWSLSNKNESSALLRPSTTALSNWKYNDLTESGKWFVDMMGASSGSLGKTDTSKTGTNKTGTNGSNTSSSKTSNSNTGKTDKNKTDTNKTGNTQSSANQSGSSKGGKLEAKVSVTNSWESNGQKFNQYSLELKNVGTGQVDSWSCTISFSKNVKVSQSWCGHYTLSGKSLTITPETYNAAVAPGSTVTNVGFIMEVEDGAEISSVTCK